MKSCTALLVLATLAFGVKEAAACEEQARFDILMCKSHMCTNCVLEWCTETCQRVQHDFPLCRCADWPESRMLYSGGDFAGKGKYGDVGDYSRSAVPAV
mmetsp:Transcript_83909/g.195204  ORF Transcript_83909/g.195204 Transcript_83909/m.195204 type:complete len:99 (+) Transcript_83909:75-371(+)